MVAELSQARRSWHPARVRVIGGALLVALLVTVPGCQLPGWRRKPSRQDQELASIVARSRRPLQRVGVVTLVNEEDRFVLIDGGSLPPPAVNVRLLCYTGPTPSGELKASAVRRRPFVVADLVSGTPRAGDEVFEAAEIAPARPPRR